MIRCEDIQDIPDYRSETISVGLLEDTRENIVKLLQVELDNSRQFQTSMNLEGAQLLPVQLDVNTRVWEA